MRSRASWVLAVSFAAFLLANVAESGAGGANQNGTGSDLGRYPLTGEATTVAKSPVVQITRITSAGPSRFLPGQHVAIMGAGPVTRLSPPSGLRIVQVGRSGNATQTYEVTAVDALGGESLPSPPATTRKGSPALTFHDYNRLIWAQVSGAVAYRLYGRNGNSGPLSLITTVPDNKWWDMGFAADSVISPLSSKRPPTSPTHDNFFATIVSVNGSRLTLSAGVVSSGGFMIARDDATPIGELLSKVASSGGGMASIPRGAYYQIARSIQLSNGNGVLLNGRGSVLRPLVALGGAPVFVITDSRSSGLEHFRIEGNSVMPPSAAILSRTVRGQSTHLIVWDVSAGSASSHSLVYGLAFTAATGHDSNNDVSDIEYLSVANYSDSAVYSGHLNSLAHNLFDLHTAYGPIGIRTAGGSFVVYGGVFATKTLEFDIEDGVQEHADMVIGATSEDDAALIHTSPTVGGVRFYIAGSDFKGGPLNHEPYDIDFQARAKSVLSMENSQCHVGGAGAVLFSDPGSNAYLIRDDLGFPSVHYAGTLHLSNNIWAPGKVALDAGRGGKLFQCADTGGGLESKPPQGKHVRLGGLLKAKRSCSRDESTGGLARLQRLSRLR